MPQQETGTELSQRIKRALKRIPRGKVATYAQIAALAGHPRAVRAVFWILHSSSRKAKLPWQRVINSRGRISLKLGNGYEQQRALLEREGIVFELGGSVDLGRYQWRP
jgi:methylated-DNA-protein-cysteine methyltransferase-like protein